MLKWLIGVALAAVPAVSVLGCRTEDVVAAADVASVGSAAAAGVAAGGAAASAGGADAGKMGEPGGTGEAGSPATNCADLVRDSGESDVDCGGACPACAIGATCTSNGDCASGSCTAGKCAATLSIYYQTSERMDPALMVRPAFEVRNDTASAVPISELEIRYFFSNEGSGTPVAQCALLQPGCDVVQLSFGQIMPARPLADTYLSVTFGATAPSVAAHSTSGRYEITFHENGIGLFQQSNDYSFDPNFTDPAPSDKTCLYRNGKLIWGHEPPP